MSLIITEEGSVKRAISNGNFIGLRLIPFLACCFTLRLFTKP